MKNKRVVLMVAIIFIFVIAYLAQKGGLWQDNKKIIISAAEVSSGEVSDRRVGGILRHELTSKELSEFIDFFNDCGITERDFIKNPGLHTYMSTSSDITLNMNDGSKIYIMAFWDGEICVTDEHNNKYYSFNNERLLDYIKSMGKLVISY
ncbi:MAG: hypothetical protein AAGU76_09940 [Sedimentibacter sp.]|uniref:hypothetical protein n=1 Tax=Sedimentibacter sp. TaxID=1960295 RepID=UPI003159822F